MEKEQNKNLVIRKLIGSKKAIILFFVLLFPSLLYIFLSTGKHKFIKLQYYGPKEARTILVAGKEKADTLYHSIPPFQFINQLGETITEKDYEGKIYVADFFFSTCQSICPKMTSQMSRVQNKFMETPDVMFLSHTVDPETDSAEVLNAYAQKNQANHQKWNFVTGPKEDLYSIARTGYLINALEGGEGEEDFIHSELFLLIDKERHIRGIYDGTDAVAVNKLMDDIKVLIAEYAIKKTKDEG